MSVKSFRALLLLDVAITVFWLSVGFLGDPFLQSEVRDTANDTSYVGPPWLETAFLWLVVPEIIIWGTALFLLWRLQPAGRWLYVLQWILGLLASATIDYSTWSGIISAIEGVTVIIPVAILILPFLPPLSERFGPKE